MQPNRPASSSGGCRRSPSRSSPYRVDRESRPSAPLHSRRFGPAKRGGHRARSARRAGSAAALRRRTYSRPCGASGARRGERWHFHPSSAGRLGGRGALVRSTAAPCHCTQWPGQAGRSGGRSSTPCALAAWLDVGGIRPVLKHGPRSATVARVFGRSNPCGCAMKVKAGLVARRGESRSRGAPSTDPLPRCGGIRVRALLLRPERW